MSSTPYKFDPKFIPYISSSYYSIPGWKWILCVHFSNLSVNIYIVNCYFYVKFNMILGNVILAKKACKILRFQLRFLCPVDHHWSSIAVMTMHQLNFVFQVDKTSFLPKPEEPKPFTTPFPNMYVFCKVSHLIKQSEERHLWINSWHYCFTYTRYHFLENLLLYPLPQDSAFLVLFKMCPCKFL